MYSLCLALEWLQNWIGDDLLQDQVQRKRKLKEQHEPQRQKQIKLDKQRTMQVGSLVQVVKNEVSLLPLSSNTTKSTPTPNGQVIIPQWQGMPGLNMIFAQYEHGNEKGRAPPKLPRSKREVCN
jgi:hypothetical protein